MSDQNKDKKEVKDTPELPPEFEIPESVKAIVEAKKEVQEVMRKHRISRAETLLVLQLIFADILLDNAAEDAQMAIQEYLSKFINPNIQPSKNGNKIN